MNITDRKIPEGKHYTISIKLYGKDGRKRIHKELILPPSVNLPDAEYIFECLVKQGTKQGDALILKDKEK